MDSFDVEEVATQLINRKSLKIKIIDATHGFVDPFSISYDEFSAQYFNELCHQFLAEVADSFGNSPSANNT